MVRALFRRPKILVAILLVGILLAVAGGGGAWSWRKAKKKQALLDAAAAAEEAGDWAAVESALRHYVSLKGEDAKTFQRIGQAIEKGAVDDRDRLRALPFYVRAISLAPQNDFVRLRFADLQLEESPRQAVQYADQVLQRDRENGDAWRIKALGLVRLATKSSKTDDWLVETHQALATALRFQPGNPRLAGQAAEFDQRQAAKLAPALRKSPAELQQAAMEILDRLVAEAEDEAEARLTRLLFRRKYCVAGQDDRVIGEDLQRLVALRPSSNVVRLLAAGWSARRAFPESQRGAAPVSDPAAVAEAKSHLTEAVKHGGDDPVPHWSLAQLHWWCGEREQALAALEQGREHAGRDNPILNLRLAETQLAVGRWSEARATLQQLDQIVAGGAGASKSAGELRPVVDLLWAQWWLAAGNPAAAPAQALPILERYAGETLRPGLRGLAAYLRGVAFASLSRWDEAAEAFLQATQITDGRALPRLAAGYALYQLGRYREASAQYRLALGTSPSRNAEPLNLTQAWIETARCALAEQSQRPAWKRDWRWFDPAVANVRQRLPNSTIPLFLELEAAQLRTDAAVKSEVEARLREAQKNSGDSPEFIEQLATYRLRIGDLAAAEQAIGSWEQKTNKVAREFRAELAQAKGDLEAADRLWQEASASRPEHVQQKILTRRIQLALQQGHPDRARKLLEAWLAAHPTDAEGVFQLAQVAWAEGNPTAVQQSAAALRRIEGDASRRWQVAQTQALLLQAAKPNSESARKELDRVCTALATRFPKDRQVRSLQAMVAEALGQTRLAVKAWRQAVELGEQDPAVLLRLASLLHSQGQSREALELCLTIAPKVADCRVAALAARIMTTAVVDSADQAHAEDLFRQILSGPPRRDLPLLLLDLAVLREYQGKPEEAVALTRQALQSQPQAVELMNNLAWFLAAYQHDHAAAEKLIDQAIQVAGPLPPLLDTRGVVLLIAGRPADAVRALEASVQGDAVPAARLLHLAEAYRLSGRNDDAKRVLGQAESRGVNVSELSPRDRKAYLKLKAQS